MATAAGSWSGLGPLAQLLAAAGAWAGAARRVFSLDRLVRVNITNQYTGYSLIQVGQCMIFFNFRLMVPVRAACLRMF